MNKSLFHCFPAFYTIASIYSLFSNDTGLPHPPKLHAHREINLLFDLSDDKIKIHWDETF